MSDMISRDRVLSLLGLDHNDYVYLDKRELAKRVEKIKGMDIVRCKECKYAHMTYGGDCKYCDMWKDDDDRCIELYLDGDFYCADGERGEP